MPEYEHQHVVSEVLLRRFAGTDGTIGVYDIVDRREFATGPGAVGAVSNFIAFEPKASEETWSAIETRLPNLIAMIEEGADPSDPSVDEAAKDIFALHWARSHTMRVIWETSVPRNLDRRQLEMLNSPELPAVFRDLTGLEPVGIGALEYAAEAIRRRIEENFGTGELFSERIHAQFAEVRERLDPLSVEVTKLREGEFILGDNPALTISRDLPGAGPLGGVPWSSADTVVLPLGPYLALSFAQVPRTIDGDLRYVEVVNAAQARGALRHLFFRPESALGAVIRSRFEGGPRRS
jgi:Protein of unknown function (DUF4238)